MQFKHSPKHSFRTIFRDKVYLVFLLIYMLALIGIAILVRQKQILPQHPAGGNVYYANSGDNLTNKARVLQPGDTLLLNDGVYYSYLDIEGKVGTATAPITIKAVNDGKAIIDGSHITTNYTPVVFIGNGSAYIDVEGIVARNAPRSSTNTSFDESVIYVYGNSNNRIGGADHITLRRITAYNAGVGDVHVFNISYGATNVLVEDCAAWGQGRYKFIAYRSDHVTFRRDWAYWEGNTIYAAPRAPFSVYGSTNTLLENDIDMNAIPTRPDDNFYTAAWQTSSNAPWADNNTTVLGSMFLNNWDGYWANDDVGRTQFKDDYFETPQLSGTYTTKPQGEGLRWNSSTAQGTIANSTFVNSVVGLNYLAGSPPSLTNSVFLNNTTAIHNDPGHSYSDFYGNGSNGTSLVATDKQVNPYDTATYGKGAYLFVPQGSALKGTGQNGADIGANIIYEYVNRQLTNTHLWPWPMEGRIMAEKGISVTWASNGGFWKTLNGVYPTTTPALSPKGAQTTNLMQHPSFETGITPWLININKMQDQFRRTRPK